MWTRVPSVTGSPILIALGANLPGPHGSPEQTLEAARRYLEQHMLILRASRTWLCAPVPASEQPWYRNAVISVETVLPALGLFEMLKDTEERFGRTRTQKNEARILDLDLLTYRDELLKSPDLTLPHPRMQDRAFVLLPLQEVAPDWMHPVLKQHISELVKNLPRDQVAKPMDGHAT
ncbi:MAG: 2-amino-4-hydroxy-6-hydroxymethyldihydropteridine diphosphokinase [Alphaproteobacteria bacterium]